ncbi:hypothetical protein [Domibacillus iocasae]
MFTSAMVGIICGMIGCFIKNVKK